MNRISTFTFVLIGIAAAVAVVILIAPHANANPDGLEKVAAAKGIDSEARDHDLVDGPFAGYGGNGVEDRYVETWIAGLLGVLVTFVVGAGIVYAVRRSRRPEPPTSTGPPVAA